MDIDAFVSKAANRQIRKSVIASPMVGKDGFVTIHTRIHQHVHALLKAQAQENGLSLARMIEVILLDKYKPMLLEQERLEQERVKKLVGWVASNPNETE